MIIDRVVPNDVEGFTWMKQASPSAKVDAKTFREMERVFLLSSLISLVALRVANRTFNSYWYGKKINIYNACRHIQYMRKNRRGERPW
jgi:hypothetical protein